MFCGFHEMVKCEECHAKVKNEIDRRDAVIAVLRQTLLDHLLKNVDTAYKVAKLDYIVNPPKIESKSEKLSIPKRSHKKK
jgi:hypothetical protein